MRLITVDGRLGGDAEIKTSKDGRPYIRFKIANNQYSGGEVETDWFDITSYDPFVIEKRADKLVKGTYVIVTGNMRSKLNRTHDSLWLNHYVTAFNIEMPHGSAKGAQGRATSAEPEISVYTAGTPSVRIENSDTAPSPAYSMTGMENNDDMPF